MDYSVAAALGDRHADSRAQTPETVTVGHCHGHGDVTRVTVTVLKYRWCQHRTGTVKSLTELFHAASLVFKPELSLPA
jgi:hypothetical protein